MVKQKLRRYFPELIILILLIVISSESFSQPSFPYFLKGTWKIEGKELYERWDSLNTTSLKGFSFFQKETGITVLEYLDIKEINNEIVYTATVLGQNEGNGINFFLAKNDSAYCFESPTHDFPKKIIYQKIGESIILVTLSDGNEKNMKIKFFKIDGVLSP